ncbi:MAG TPA: DUF1353 domain-containing protein [Bacteroidia bacterium]|nr:DUF1353 domain-containing protein [Bacteroidia bacterium]
MLVVVKEFAYKDRYGIDRLCQRGFLNDGASRPAFTEPFLQKDSLNNGSYLVHDHMYWEQYCTRYEADIRLLINLLLNPENSVRYCLRVFFILRISGGNAWKSNQELKSMYGRLNRYMHEQDILELENRICKQDE